MWAEVLIGAVGCVVVLGAVWRRQRYPWPRGARQAYAGRTGSGAGRRLVIPTGIAYPVLIMLGVALVMTYLATRRRFGRYVYAIGGNPEAAELGGINVRSDDHDDVRADGRPRARSARRSRPRASTPRSRTWACRTSSTSSRRPSSAAPRSPAASARSPGAILGAVVMQSLRSGMLLLNVDSPTQDVVVGIVLVAAVGFDAFLRRRAG